MVRITSFTYVSLCLKLITNYRRRDGKVIRPQNQNKCWNWNWKHHPLSRAHHSHMMAPPPWQVCIVTPTFDVIDFTHGGCTNVLWLGTLSLPALHAEQLSWIHFQLDQYSILALVGKCGWLLLMAKCCCLCWKPIYSNLWEFELATSLKFTTYDFKADLFLRIHQGKPYALPKTERDLFKDIPKTFI